jgi:hypothetical protein
MSDVFLERDFSPPISAGDVLQMARDGAHCFGLYHIDWQGSLLSAGGRHMLCHFSSPDTDSVRLALRQAGSVDGRVWPGTVHLAAGFDPTSDGQANVVVTRQWDRPVTLEEIQAIEDAGAWCLDSHRVRFVRTYFATDHRRMACLYQAPDAEAVRLAQSQAGLPVERVWAFEAVSPGG